MKIFFNLKDNSESNKIEFEEIVKTFGTIVDSRANGNETLYTLKFTSVQDCMEFGNAALSFK